LALASCALSASSARAARLTIEPDLYPVGSEISSAHSGVLLSAIGAGSHVPPDVSSAQVFTRFSSLAATGNRVFGNSSYSELWFGNHANFRADFPNPTSFVSLDFIADDALDPAVLRAFALDGRLLAESAVVGFAGAGVVETASIERASPDIGYIVATNPDGFLGQQFLIDRLVFEASPFGPARGPWRTADIASIRWESPDAAFAPAPEPASLALAGTTILFAAAFWRASRIRR
jgi:hypothetical protein